MIVSLLIVVMYFAQTKVNNRRLLADISSL